MSNIVLIPARVGSKGIKFKNIVPINGKPLIYYAAYAAEKSPNVDKIVVATDSDKISTVALGFKFKKLEIYKRQKRNAQDTSKTIDLVLEYTKNLKPDDTLILIQATSPLTTEKDITEAIKEFGKGDCDSLLSCVETDGFYWDLNGNPILHDYKNRPRRQDYHPQLLKENGAIYINKVKNIIKNKSLLSGKIKPFIMDKLYSCEIDEPKDILKAEELLQKRTCTNIDFQKLKMILVDCDGTMTDGGMYYTKAGEHLKKFNAKDGFGLKKIRDKGFIVGIITGEDNNIVRKRAEKLKIDELHMGSNDKLPIVEKLAQKYNINLENIVYIGDDLNDYDAIKNVGFGCATANANNEVKKIAKYITHTPGGMGAIREVIDLIISEIQR